MRYFKIITLQATIIYFVKIITVTSISCYLCRTLALLSDSSICYPNLDCFNITDDFWHITYRPFNLLPESPNKIKTTFLLYTRLNHDMPQVIMARDDNSLVLRKWAKFSGKRETKIIVHGFIDNKGIGKWMLQLKNELLIKGDFNVILVDWKEGNGMPYLQATANTRLIGAETARLIAYLNYKTGLSYERIHIIGHSLGAHVASYAAKKISSKYANKKIGRITGLDPAEPYFQYMPVSVRLDKTDAHFVDIIHSDSKSILQLGFGMSQAIGDIDFYPNSGREQPGCSTDRFLSFITHGLVEGTRQFVACNHLRSVDYFIASINKCKFLSFECNSWDEFKWGKCFECGATNQSTCAFMGMNANQRMLNTFKNKSFSKRFYLRTSDDVPYCANHYKLELKFGKSEKFKPQFGILMVKVNNNSINSDQNAQVINPGYSYQLVFSTPDQLTTIEYIEFKWKPEVNNLFMPSTWQLKLFDTSNDSDKQSDELLYVSYISLKTIDNTFMERLWKFCVNSTTDSGIKPNSWYKLDQLC